MLNTTEKRISELKDRSEKIKRMRHREEKMKKRRKRKGFNSRRLIDTEMMWSLAERS